MANLFRVVVAEESEGTTEPIGKAKMSDPVLSLVQKAQLQAILDEFSDVVTIELGSVKVEPMLSSLTAPHLCALFLIG